MTQQPSDYPVSDPGDEPEGPAAFLDDAEDDGAEPKGDSADVADQQLPPPGDEEEEALDRLADRSARTDGDRPV